MRTWPMGLLADLNWRARFILSSAGSWLVGPRGNAEFRREFLSLAFEAAYLGCKKKFDRAMRSVGDAGRLDAPTLAHLALSCWRFGDNASAKRFFEMANARQPDDPAVLKRYGSYLTEQGRIEEGIACLLRGLETDPHDSAALTSLGIGYSKLGRLAQARNCFLQSIHEDTEDRGEAYMNLAFVASEEERWEEAVSLWRESVKRLPHVHVVWYNLGNSLVHLGQYRQAVRAFNTSLRLGWPERHRALYGIALSYLEMQHEKKARQFCDLALKAEPGYQLARDLQDEMRN